MEPDSTSALIWYRKAALQGDAEAQLKVSQMYAEGDGTEINYAQSKLWMQKAADQGNDIAKEYLQRFDSFK